MFQVLLSRILAAFRVRRLDEEFDEEVRAHLDMLTERFIRRGMDPTEAYLAARRQFGSLSQIKQDLRERRGLPPIDLLVQDLRHAFRRLHRSKRFTAWAVLTLALGIGATTAVFAVVDTVLLEPLPYAGPDRLMAFRSLRRGAPQPGEFSYPDFFDFREQNRVFEHLVSYRSAPFTLTDSQPPIQVTGEIVSWDLFPLVGVQPALGRGFRPEDEQPGMHVAVLSHGLWTNRFGADERILGQGIPINGVPFTVVGVAPQGFQFPVEVPGVQLWVALSEDAASRFERGARMLDGIGRLKPGVSIEQARTQMDAVAGALAQQYPDSNTNATAWIQPELQRLAGLVEAPMLILFGAVALVLLIACGNVASLLLARTTERAGELALRMALGASRAALVRELLIESLALSLLGTAGGVLLAMGALKAILPLAGDRIPRLAETSVDGEVLAFSAVLAVLTSVVFGMAPALRAAYADPAGGLKESARTLAPGHDRFRNALVVAQVALGLVLLVGAELLITSFLRVVQTDPGFRADHLLAFNIGVSERQDTVAEQIAFGDRLLERMTAIPGVQLAATGRPLPLQGHEMRAAFEIQGRQTAPSERPRADMAIVSPGYFATMGIPLLRGRPFSERDEIGAPLVVLVNRTFARQYFPGEDVIGKRIQSGVGGSPETPRVVREIVGVVGDARQSVVGADLESIYYFPYKQLPWGIGTIVLRTAVPPLEVVSSARAALASLDRQLPMGQIQTGEELSSAVMVPARLLTVLMGSFAGIALLLTVAGLYGVLSYMVAMRRREIGVRIALGAGRAEVVAIVWRRAALLVTAGLIVGSAGAFAAARLLSNTVFGVPAGIPMIVAGACCVIALASSVAAFVPAARAASVDPMQALRSE